MRYLARRRNLFALSSFAAYRGPGRRDDNGGDAGNANPGGGGAGSSGSGQGGGAAGDGQQTGQPGSGQQGQQSGQEPPTGQRVEDLPEWAQKLVRDARADAGKARTTAKQQAADEARQALAQEIGKALGLVKGDEQTDPAKLAEQLTAKTSSERDALVRLAVYETVKDHGGNPAALTDSRTFLAKVAKLDPTADDFAAQVAAAAKEAVDANPTLKAAAQAAAPAGGVEITGGAGGGAPRTYTRAQLRDSKFFADNKADIMAAMREGRIKE